MDSDFDLVVLVVTISEEEAAVVNLVFELTSMVSALLNDHRKDARYGTDGVNQKRVKDKWYSLIERLFDSEDRFFIIR